MNDWLISGGPHRPVPLQERSLALLGDEKALGHFLGGPLFNSPGRLTLEILGAVRTSPPFVFTRKSSGPYALVIENSATYRSVLQALPNNSPVGVVAFGFGNGFVRSVEFFLELAERGGPVDPIREIRYFGDVDEDGLRIPRSASQFATELGLPPVRPAIGLYRRLLEHGTPQSRPPLEPGIAAELASWLPDDLADRAAGYLVLGQRLAQEAVGLDELMDDRTWANADELGVPEPAQVGWLRPVGLPAGEAALVRDDDRIPRSPTTGMAGSAQV